MTTYTIVAGKLRAWKVREFCSDAEHMGYNIRWKEDNGWLQSRFLISGDDQDVDDLYEQLMRLKRYV